MSISEILSSPACGCCSHAGSDGHSHRAALSLGHSLPWYTPKDYCLVCVLHFQVFHYFYIFNLNLDPLIKRYNPSVASFPLGYYISCVLV